MYNKIEKIDVRYEERGLLVEGSVYIIPANPNNGFNCGYSVFIPKNCNNDTSLIMHSCNTAGKGLKIDNNGNKTIDKQKSARHLDEANEVAKIHTINFNSGMWIGYNLGMPVMIPLIPRVKYYYTQGLERRVFHNDISHLVAKNELDGEKLSQEEIYRIQQQCRNIPDQVVNMIKSSKQFLNSLGIKVDDKVIAEGYSAGSKFANRFAILHPELVKACVCGGLTGLGVLPISKIDGEVLEFPVGVSNVANFNKEKFLKIPQLYYMGMDDYNDSAAYRTKKDENGNIVPDLDSNGNLLPYYSDGITSEELLQVHKILGSDPQVRFKKMQALYNEYGINATFKLFPGDHNTVNNYIDGELVDRHTDLTGKRFDTNRCIEEFIISVLQKEKQQQETETKKIVGKKSFDKREPIEVETGKLIQQKNQATAQQKKQKYFKENKQLVLTNNNHVSGFASLFFLALTTGFVAGIGTMIIYLMIR